MIHYSNPTLLIVEDSDEDYRAFLRVFRGLTGPQPVEHCVNAKECLDYLYGEGKYQERGNSELPALLLLDLNLPGMGGFSVLRHVKATPTLKRLPIVIFTTSTNPKDVEACYAAGASSYLVKPVGFEAFEQTIRRFVDYWFHAVSLPSARQEA